MAKILTGETSAPRITIVWKTDLAALKAELKADIADVEADILKWVVGAIGAVQ